MYNRLTIKITFTHDFYQIIIISLWCNWDISQDRILPQNALFKEKDHIQNILWYGILELFCVLIQEDKEQEDYL